MNICEHCQAFGAIAGPGSLLDLLDVLLSVLENLSAARHSVSRLSTIQAWTQWYDSCIFFVLFALLGEQFVVHQWEVVAGVDRKHIRGITAVDSQHTPSLEL